MENNVDSKDELTQLLVINENSKNNEEILEEIELEETYQCRICLEDETNMDLLISPCRCNGTSKYVHKECLRRWRYQDIEADGFYRCMECHENYILMESENREIIKIFYFWDTSKDLFKFQGYISLPLALTISYIDYYATDYSFVKIFPLDNTTFTDENILTIVKTDSFYFMSFYLSMSIFFANYIFFTTYLIRFFYFIKNKKKILKKMFLNFYSINFYYNIFWLIILFGIKTDVIGIILNLALIVQGFSYKLNHALIKNHDNTIDEYNNEIRVEVGDYNQLQVENEESDNSEEESEYDSEEDYSTDVENNIEMV